MSLNELNACFSANPSAGIRYYRRWYQNFLGKLALAVMAALGTVAAAQVPEPKQLPPVTVSTPANRDPAEKSYRSIVKGMNLFEQQRSLSPAGELRFKLLARKRDTDMRNIDIEVIGTQTAFAVPVAADQTFALPRNAAALDENAQVVPNRKAQTMTWRADIRTPGLAPNTRRLGDLRLECRVGMASGLVSSNSTLVGRLTGALLDTPAYCDKKIPLYLFFADRALFSVTLLSGTRKEVLPISQLYAAASDDPTLTNDLPECDCEVLVDRTYFLPLGDASWPDDTLVEFEYMEAK
jgi:hypothetical protein